ncbi:hypothetical protein ACWFMI_23080 [Nocardiopsis terrae]|uniref:hypothetical protein n=1 Tax=Streptomyces sp. NPDC057554 TaxID=3350538 RepID=UPI0036B668AC
MSKHEIIASNGREVDFDDPAPTWGYTDSDGNAFLDQVIYEEGDEVTDAIMRFQRQGKLPVGEAEVTRGTRLSDYWIHEEHPHAYNVTITRTDD